MLIPFAPGLPDLFPLLLSSDEAGCCTGAPLLTLLANAPLPPNSIPAPPPVNLCDLAFAPALIFINF